MSVFCVVAATIMLIVGIAFFTGRAAEYMRDYQNMEEKEKKNIKIGILCKNISLLFFLATLIFAIAGFFEVFRQAYFKWVIIGWFLLGAADVVYVYTPAVKKPSPVS